MEAADSSRRCQTSGTEALQDAWAEHLRQAEPLA
jgi:hypothetical protein